MKAAAAALLLLLPLTASAPAQQAATPLEQSLQQARAEEAVADRETARLEQAAAAANSQAARLQGQQVAAAQALEAAEARITAADAQYRLAEAYAAAYRLRLATEQRPLSSLLAGLATMAGRPPLLAIADRGSVDDLVRVSVLLDTTLPVIRARTQALSVQLARGQQLEAATLSARAQLVQSRRALAAKQQSFAELQWQAVERSITTSGEALSVGDVAISANEQIEQLKGEQARQVSAANVARQFEQQGPAPGRPFPSQSAPLTAPFAYTLPVHAPVLAGVGSVDESGVRSRGISFHTARGAPVVAPAAGTVRYSGPFRDFDGVVILDHGKGWLSVLVNVASPLKVGDKVEAGDPLGRALGPVEVQLSAGGRLLSPALIAGSSPGLSKDSKGS